MKKLKVKKGSTCMACLACVEACSEAFYKVFDPDKACLQITEKKTVRPIACRGMSGRRHHTECKGRIHDQQEKMYRLWCLRKGMSVWPDCKGRGYHAGIKMYRLRYLRKSLSNGCT